MADLEPRPKPRLVRTAHRRPPPPPYLGLAKGLCCMCGEIILEGARPTQRRWHEDCFTLWRIMAWPEETRRFVFSRDKGVCCDCGAVDARIDGDWDVDHERSLVSAGRDPEAWKPANLKTRCRHNCHREKTIRENRERFSRGTLRHVQSSQDPDPGREAQGEAD